MAYILLSPVVVFIVALGVTSILSDLAKKLAIKKKHSTCGMHKAYACGENVDRTKAHPNYSQFFSFAFFFTFLHVIALIITTVPTETMQNFFMAMVYILGAVVGLNILFRGQTS